MILMTVFLIISVVGNLFLGYGFWNSTKLNKKYEDVIIKMKNKLDEIYENLKVVDINGSFESDDEVGFVFSYIFEMIRELNQTFNPDKVYEGQRKKQKEEKRLEEFS